MKYVLKPLLTALSGGLAIALSTISVAGSTAGPELKLQWETSGLRVPESVYPYNHGDKTVLFVSEIEGASNVADGKGGIAQLSIDGKIINQNWIRGLNAPKGMRHFEGKLYVADLHDVAVIDIDKGKVVQRIPIQDSVFLNDIAIDAKGVVYVSDTRTHKIHRLIDHKPELYLDNIEAANGLTVADGLLYIGAGSDLWAVSPDGEPEKIATGFAERADGVEKIGDNEFIVSCWAGIVYHVKNGQLTTLLDTRDSEKNTADIGWVQGTGMVYVPTFNSHSVAAYRYSPAE